MPAICFLFSLAFLLRSSRDPRYFEKGEKKLYSAAELGKRKSQIDRRWSVYRLCHAVCIRQRRGGGKEEIDCFHG